MPETQVSIARLVPEGIFGWLIGTALMLVVPCCGFCGQGDLSRGAAYSRFTIELRLFD